MKKKTLNKLEIDYKASDLVTEITQNNKTYNDLTKQQKTLVIDYLHYIKGYTQQAIADFLGINRTTVWKRLKTIKKKEEKIVLESLSKRQIIHDIFTKMNARYDDLVMQEKHKRAFDVLVDGYKILSELGALPEEDSRSELRVTFYHRNYDNFDR